MTKLQKLQVRQSEIREKLNKLLGVDSRTKEQETELTKLTAEGVAIEPEIRAAIVASPDETQTDTEGTTEARQLSDLADKSDMGRIYAAVIEHRQVDGREKELQTELGLSANQLPLSMLRTEHRAVTPGATNVGQTQAEITPYVFPQSVAAFLGVDMPVVGTGEAVFPVPDQEAGRQDSSRVRLGYRNHRGILGCGSEPCQVASEFLLQQRGSRPLRRNGCIPTAKLERRPS